VRGRIRLFILQHSALCGRLRSSSHPSPGEIGHIKADLTAISYCHTLTTTGLEASENRLRLHSAARRASDFLQVAPIETASAGTIRLSRPLVPEAVPIGR
jgi:hypothetical protein